MVGETAIPLIKMFKSLLELLLRKKYLMLKMNYIRFEKNVKFHACKIN